MKTNKIAKRLMAYFGCTLILFSIVVGSVFAYFFARYTTALHRSELGDKAISIAGNLSGYMSGERDVSGMGRGGFGMYLRNLDEIAMCEVWVVDGTTMKIIQSQDCCNVSYSSELPDDAEGVIARALAGEVAFSEGFSPVLGSHSLTVAAPIVDSRAQTIGVVLLHAPIQGVDHAIGEGMWTLGLSIVLAICVTAMMTTGLSISFTKPLRQMRDTAEQIAAGDYTVTTGVAQKDEIGELATSMDIMAGKLREAEQQGEQLERLRKELVTNISHELRTPVTVLRSSLEALCDGVVSGEEQTAEYHSQMLRDTIHLQRLVNDLMELTRLQNDGFTIELGELELGEVLHDVARSMTQPAAARNVTIAIEGTLPTVAVDGDYGRLRQLLMILTDNAIKFSDMGSVVKLSLQVDGGSAVLHVVDCGEVIPPDRIPQLFERFYRITSEDNRMGSGLGLCIAQELVRRHHGTITAISEDRITDFIVTLPTKETPAHS